MTAPLVPVIVLFLLSAALGVFAADTKRRALLIVTKPLTTLLLFAVVGWPSSRFAWLIYIGILFSLAGDVALLRASKSAFLVGLVLFLGAHGSYVGAFVGAATAGGTRDFGWQSMPVAATTLLMALVTAALLRTLWPGVAGMRAPLVVYALALASLVVSAVAAVHAGPSAVGPAVALSAAVGAGLFYVSDSGLALDVFRRPIPHAPLLTLGIYWLGQLGIALAARGMSPPA